MRPKQPLTTHDLKWGHHHLVFGERPLIMGILNVTPDSFSDGGKFLEAHKAIAQAEKMITDGADIIDIGGESTRPFSETVAESEELKRVIPVIEALAKHVSVPISIDTTKAEVARQALYAGASIINDIGALRLESELAEVASTHDVPIILMHMKGTPRDMQVAPVYDDVITEIYSFLERAKNRAQKMGIPSSRIILDPGIGFGKTIEHNLIIINKLSIFKKLGTPLLLGPSRKAFIRKILKPDHMDDIDPQSTLVETGTQATVTAAALNGADILRVHNVANTLATLKVAGALKRTNMD